MKTLKIMVFKKYTNTVEPRNSVLYSKNSYSYCSCCRCSLISIKKSIKSNKITIDNSRFN